MENSQKDVLYLLDYLANHRDFIDEVVQLKYDQWLHTSPDRPYDVWSAEISESARSDGTPLTLVALAGLTAEPYELAGFVTLIQIAENAGIENGLWMITLYVKPEYRRLGIGTHLINRCIQERKRLEHSDMYLWTDSKMLTTFYSKRGWKLVGTVQETGEDVMVFKDTHITPSGTEEE